MLEHFNKALKSDKARPQIAQLSELGLVELTRKRQGQNIYELFGRPCPTCNGLGHVVHLPGEVATQEREPIVPPVSVPAPIVSRSLPIPEQIDRPIVNSYRDYPGASAPITSNKVEAAAQPDNFWEPEGFADDLGSSDMDMDLLNHPNYQERGLAGNPRRRRRRRIEIGEGGRLEEEPRSTSPYLASGAGTGSISGEPTKWMGESEAPLSSKPYSPIVAKGLRLDPERSRTIKPEPTQAEVVSVEMTPEEQQVYAFMGVSPLVRLNRQVKNPKATTVMVKLPGQAEEDASYEPSPVVEDDGMGESDRTERFSPSPSYQSLSSYEPEPRIDPPQPEVGEISTESYSTMGTTSEGESGDSLMRRRRRRRSSAIDSDSDR